MSPPCIYFNVSDVMLEQHYMVLTLPKVNMIKVADWKSVCLNTETKWAINYKLTTIIWNNRTFNIIYRSFLIFLSLSMFNLKFYWMCFQRKKMFSNLKNAICGLKVKKWINYQTNYLENEKISFFLMNLFTQSQ